MAEKKPETVRDINPTEYITQFDLDDKDLTVLITDVQIGELPIAGTSKTQRRGVLLIDDAPVNKMVLNTTNIKIIANLYGGELSRWVGERITIYRDPSIKFGPKKTGGIRVRPVKPPRNQQRPAQAKAKPVTNTPAPALADILRGFKMAETETELKSAGAAARGLEGDAKEQATLAYKARLEQLRKAPEPEHDYGPPPMTDADLELFESEPVTGRVE